MTPTEIRYATMDWGVELDEIVGHGSVQMESLDAAAWYVHVEGVRCTMHLVRLPRMLWWEEIVEAWRERRWPCFWRMVLRVDETQQGKPVRTTLDGREVNLIQESRLHGWG